MQARKAFKLYLKRLFYRAERICYVEDCVQIAPLRPLSCRARSHAVAYKMDQRQLAASLEARPLLFPQPAPANALLRPNQRPRSPQLS